MLCTVSDCMIRDTLYSEASVPTPPDQEDVSPIDLVSDAVEKVMDNVRDGMVLKNETANSYDAQPLTLHGN
jgi:hypothetical protein